MKFLPFVWLVACMGLSSTEANAQEVGSFTIHEDVLLAGEPGTFYAAGAGAPTVGWDGVSERYIMVFETPLGTDPLCPVGVWGLGVALSTDGLTWNVASNPIINPTPGNGSYYSCVAAHPTASFDTASNTMLIFFKGEQGTDACDTTTPSWGCETWTGLGRILVHLNPDGSVASKSVSAEPVLVVGQNFGFPKFVEVDGVYNILFSIYPNIYRATGTSINALTMDDPDPILEPSKTIFWANQEVFNPAAACEASSGFPYVSYFGGRNTSEWLITDAGWGKAISASAEGGSWFRNENAYFSWGTESDWRHWEVLLVGTEDHLVFYSEKDGAGKPQIRLAYTNPDWDDSQVYDKRCSL